MKSISFRTPDYKNLVCYQKAEAVYDITSLFCSRYLSTKDRTYDQMIQAARSGKQNIAEGQAAMPTSMESCLKLINVAKASLHELMADYEDYLRTHELKRWDENTPEFRQIRELGRTHNDAAFYCSLAEQYDADQIANMAIIVIKQTDYLLYRLLEKIHQMFVEQGGFREQLSHKRKTQRKRD